MLILALATSAQGQVPDPDPVPPETPPGEPVEIPIPPEQVSPDTVPGQVRAAAAAPTPVLELPRFPAFGSPGWDVGRWEWTAADLARLPGMTILEFIETVPGIVAFRPGGFGRPEGITTMGAGGGRVRVFLDGYELDAHGGAAYPLQMISVVDVRRLRVERGLSGIRVEVETFVLEEPEPVSEVVLGTGVHQTRLLRGLFSRGFGTRAVGTGVFDLASTAGIGLAERYRHLNAVLRWDYVRSERFGMQLEWRRTVADRRGQLAPLETTRGDLVLRARMTPSAALNLEGFIGRNGTDEAAAAAGPPLVGAFQGGLNVAYSSGILEGEVRTRGRLERDGPLPAPDLEVEGKVAFRPVRFFRLEAASGMALADTARAGRVGVTATLQPTPMIGLFAGFERGAAIIPLVVDRASLDAEERLYAFERVSGDIGGERAGVEVAGPFGVIGVAGFRSGATDLAPFGLPFDRGWGIQRAGAATGVEVHLRLPLPRAPGLRLEGWYTRYLEASERLYAPNDIGRIAIAFHDLFVGGQLEPSMRLEALYRGSTPVPLAPGSDVVAIMPAFRTLNFSMQLRIIDVTAFLIWDNLLADREALYLPASPPSFPRIVYGGSWRFRN